jgi:hypothetical protein
MKYEEIKQKVEERELNCEKAFESLAEIGHCPNLLNDDNGHWAVIFDGFQTAPIGNEPQGIMTSFFIEEEDWKDSIYEALVWALKDEE